MSIASNEELRRKMWETGFGRIGVKREKRHP
jgi:hypothetical protein